MQEKRFTRITIDKNHPQSNIYITNKDFLRFKNNNQKKQKLEQLALMDIVVIINLIDQEILYEEIPHLNPTTVKKCQNNPFLENMGASKLIDDVLKVQQKSVAIFCDETYIKSQQLLVSYLIYDKFKIMTDIRNLDSLENRLCEINFEKKEIALNENNLHILKGFYGNPIFPNYRFKAEINQISEVLKFQQTKSISDKTYTNRDKNVTYFINGDNLNLSYPLNQLQLSKIDLNQKYFEVLEAIKDDEVVKWNSAIILKQK
ncbi:unnamed protein product [Paramecium primaurelia]|uniref:Uncharacterized protein n=1 Tax=Paramecium primaurelia TaxID=5886 RepID=A0A8S1PVM4_PARPR|nr:unnamed protein product [Paramecium primaurelia]